MTRWLGVTIRRLCDGRPDLCWTLSPRPVGGLTETRLFGCGGRSQPALRGINRVSRGQCDSSQLCGVDSSQLCRPLSNVQRAAPVASARQPAGSRLVGGLPGSSAS